MSKRVFIETYGCQMNVSDSELVKTILISAGFSVAENEDEADVVMLNTCSVRDNANRKVFNRIHRIRRRPTPVLVGVLGCMATNFRRNLLENPQLGIDFIAGPDSYRHLPQLIADASDMGQKPFNITLTEFETYQGIYPTRSDGVNAYVSIMRGCNNYCTFCVVPHTRGRERSRHPDDVVAEVERLVSEGFVQVTLLGQNVNSYRYEDVDFAALMDRVSLVPGLRRVRFTSPHPKDFPVHLLTLMRDRPVLCKQIHLPLQAGNNRILDKMNRTYTREEFFALVDQIRALMPDVSLTTDIIVGFCSETAEEFEETMDVVRRVGFDAAFMFKYSERPNTLASARFADDVPEAEKPRRVTALVAEQMQQSLARNSRWVGQEVEVLIESPRSGKGAAKEPGWIGRTDGGVLVVIPGEADAFSAGDFCRIRIVGASPHGLRGEKVMAYVA